MLPLSAFVFFIVALGAKKRAFVSDLPEFPSSGSIRRIVSTKRAIIANAPETEKVCILKVIMTRVATLGVLGESVSLGFRNLVASLNIGSSCVTRIAVSVNEATCRITFEVFITRVATLGVLGEFVSDGFRNAVVSSNIGFSFVTRIAVSVNEATCDVRITLEVFITRVATPCVLGEVVSHGLRNAALSSNIGSSFVTRIAVSVNEATRPSDRRPPNLSTLFSTLIGDLCRRLPL